MMGGPSKKTMNKKDILELRKTFKEDSSCLTDVGVCYVHVQDGPDKNVSMSKFLTLEETVMHKYLQIAKKGLYGKLGRNLSLLASDGSGVIGDGSLKDVLEEKSEESIYKLAEQIWTSYLCETDYCVLCLFGTYDVPASTKKEDEFLDSEDVYTFLQCFILPVKMSKPGLAYDLSAGDICTRILAHEINDPDQAFLYPAFTERSTDVDHILRYAKKPSVIQEPLLSMLHATVPQSPEEQLEKFRAVIKAGLGSAVPYPAIMGIYDTLSDQQDEKSKAPAFVTAAEVKEIVKREAGYSEVDFDSEAAEKEVQEGGEKPLFLENILPESVTISAGDATIRVKRKSLADVRRQTIDGVDYYLIPAAKSELDGLETRR